MVNGTHILPHLHGWNASRPCRGWRSPRRSCSNKVHAEAEVSGRIGREDGRASWAVRVSIVDTATRIFTDFCDPQTVNRAKDDAWKAPAWAALEEAGLTLAWVPEALGGAGAELADGFAVLREAGRFAAAVPLAETLLAGWLLAQRRHRLAQGRHDLRAGARRREADACRQRHA